MSEYLFGIACQRASDAFLFCMLSECVEGRREIDDNVLTGVKRAREYVERARKVGRGLASKENLAFNSEELDAYLELSEALARPKLIVPFLEPEALERETSLLVQSLNDIEGRAEFDKERKQEALALLTKLSNYFSRKFAEQARAVQEQDDD